MWSSPTTRMGPTKQRAAIVSNAHGDSTRLPTIAPMAREHDTQLIESVAVRRARMRATLLWGRHRRSRATSENLGRLAVGVVLAAVACAGCVGWAFVQHSLTSPVPAVSGPRR